ncbi:MAG: ABC transporter ATP-binding protein [Syntrophorhabdaceae bacterium]
MYKTLRELIFLFDPRTRAQFAFLFVLMLITAILESIGIGLIMPFIAVITDPSIIDRNTWLRAVKDIFGIAKPYDFLIFMGIGLVVFYILKNICLGLSSYLQLRFVFSKRSALGERLLRSYLFRPYVFHLEHNTAELLRNINVETIRVFNFVQSFLKMCSEGCIFACIIAMLLWVNPVIVLFTVGILGIISGLFYKSVSSHLKSLGQKVQTSQKYVNQAILEGLGAIKEVKVAGCETYFPGSYYRNMMDNARANWRYSTINTVPKLALEVIAVAGVIVIILVYQIQGYDIKLLLPTLSLFAMATVKSMPSLAQIIINLQNVRFDSVAVNIIYKDMKDASLEAPVKRSSPLSFNSRLAISDVSYIYPDSGQAVLKEISLEIKKGHAVALAGTSGAGKTTLANLILGLLTPTRGGIYADDQNIFDDLPAWQSIIGYVPQSIFLLDASIRKNIAFGLKENEIDEQRISEAVKTARLDSFISGLPEGLDTIIGENGVRLSGGQRQRLGIARALYHEPEVLILDEATSSLDAETEKEVSNAIEAMSGKKTMIIIAHRLSTIQRCDRIYYMKNGSIAGFGTFAELSAQNQDFRLMAESGRLEV